MKRNNFVLILIILTITILGIMGYFVNKNQTSLLLENNILIQKESVVKETKATQLDKVVKIPQLKLIKEIEINNGFWPNLVFTNNFLYVSYEKHGSVSVDQYSQEFILQKTYQLTSGEGTDHRLAFGNGFFYLVNPNYVRKFTPDFKELIKIPQTQDIPAHARQDLEGNRGFGDQLFHFSDNTLFLGKGYRSAAKSIVESKDKSSKKSSLPDNLYICAYDENLELIEAKDLLGIGHMSMSLIVRDGDIFIINSDRQFDDSSLIANRFDQLWNFLDKKVISAEAMVNEEFATGALYKDEFYYFSYMKISGVITQPTHGNDFMHVDSILKVLDDDWQLVDEVDVSEISQDKDTGHNGRPAIALAGDKIYVAYDIMGHKGEGPNVIMKAYQIKMAAD